MSAPPGAGRVPPGPPPGGPQRPAGPPAGGPLAAPPPPPPRPAAMPNFPPPLPPGWTEHRAPDGVTPYYYNAATKASTYTRPHMVVAAPPFAGAGGALPPPPGVFPPAAVAAAAAAPEKKKKKEKAKNKVPIPGTTWLRVSTNEGNVFYFEKEAKRSEWTVPDEIAEAVAALEADERAEREEQAKAERLERLREQERVRAEVEEERARKRAEKAERAEKDKERKRKAAAEDGGRAAKVAKRDGEDKAAKAGEGEGDAEGEDKEQFAPEGADDEEAWAKAVAAEFAQSDAAKAVADAEAEDAAKRAEEDAAKKVFAAADAVKVSPEEARALFKALLADKNISPFAPWEQSLPLFINDPRYVLLASMKERQIAYEEYCRDAGRQRRLNKAPAAVEKKAADPERDYRALLREEVTSTRTRFDDFKRKSKKDRRFYSYGRDDREREKAFKTHLRELGERKRADAARAEADFIDLLKEAGEVTAGAAWSDVKRRISSDVRYDAVGSSSLRAELFDNYLKKLGSEPAAPETAEEAAERKLRERKERQAASLREREGKVRAEQAQVSEAVDKSRAGAGREEAERLYGSLLVDVVRSHDMTWDAAMPILQQDPRFAHPSLRPGDKRRLFEGHIERLSSTKSNALQKLFATHAPELDTPYETVYAAIADDPLVTRMGLDAAALEDRFLAWRRAREADARRDFDVLLGENKFVDFWGRMRNKTLDEAAAKVKEHDERDEGEGLGEGGSADITSLAKQIDLEEVKSVLRRDRRYRQFDHMPEVREQWLREYLENLEGSKGSETIHSVGAGFH